MNEGTMKKFFTASTRTPASGNSRIPGSAAACDTPRITAVRNASKIDRSMRKIPPANTYKHTSEVPVCRYISTDYKHIFDLIKQAVHKKLEVEYMTKEIFEVWKMGSHNVIKFVQYFLIFLYFEYNVFEFLCYCNYLGGIKDKNMERMFTSTNKLLFILGQGQNV